MKIHKLYIVLGLLIALGMLFELAAHADETDESTKITFRAPIQIPGQELPAGTYTFKQAADQQLVQIFSADRSVLYATLQTVPVERTEPAGDTAITLAEPESGKPDVLVKWFYPGRLTGHVFVYPEKQEQEIAQATQRTFVGSEVMPSAVVAGD
jgi:hypothetical protein